MNHEIDSVSYLLDLIPRITSVCCTSANLHAARIIRVDLLDDAASAANGYQCPLLVYSTALDSKGRLLRHDWVTAPRSYFCLPGESSNRILRSRSRLLLLLEAFLRVITDWFL